MAPRGRVIIDTTTCKGCSLCVVTCPLDLLVLGAEINAKGYHPASLAGPDRCTGCALCAQMCPDVCIRVERE
jgi:2-oxoglutarate ferredoxin oxidoreductase subunit delta